MPKRKVPAYGRIGRLTPTEWAAAFARLYAIATGQDDLAADPRHVHGVALGLSREVLPAATLRRLRRCEIHRKREDSPLHSLIAQNAARRSRP